MSRSSFTVGRIARLLEQEFTALIDMSDWKGKDEDKPNAFLSRALAALCIKSRAQVDAKRAAEAVVDNFGDSGLDAIMFDQTNDVFYFVQSKWSSDGSGCPIDEKACLKFVNGINNIIDYKVTGAKSRAPPHFSLAPIRRRGLSASCAAAARPFRAEPFRA